MPFKDPEAAKRYQEEYRARNRTRLREVSKRFRARHLESSRAASRESTLAAYHARKKYDPAFIAANRAKAKAWYQANKQRAKDRIAGYRRNALIVPRQTPKWANRFVISEVYALAKLRSKALGMVHEVDHFYPLRGKLVCGLHVESNLRVVPKVVNREKGSKLISENHHAVY